MTIGDIVLEIYALTDTNVTSYPAATMLRRMNKAYELVASKLIGADGSWEWDDTNFDDFPRGIGTMVEGQKDYTFNSKYLSIERVQIKDNDGFWHFLDPIDKRNFGIPLDEYFKNNGMPGWYDKDGKSILLYPGPKADNVTLASGLRVDFRRTADLFTSGEVTTGTKEPGFASPFHWILVYEAAIPYCMSYKPKRVALFEKKSQELQAGLMDFYEKRAKDVRNRITTKYISFR